MHTDFGVGLEDGQVRSRGPALRRSAMNGASGWCEHGWSQAAGRTEPVQGRFQGGGIYRSMDERFGWLAGPFYTLSLLALLPSAGGARPMGAKVLPGERDCRRDLQPQFTPV